MVFMPDNDDEVAKCTQLTEDALKSEGFEIVGWRSVPVDSSVVGRVAAAEEPRSMQIVVHDPQDREGEELERQLFLGRKAIERRRPEIGEKANDFYICSLSTKARTFARHCCSFCMHKRRCLGLLQQPDSVHRAAPQNLPGAAVTDAQHERCSAVAARLTHAAA